MLCGYKMNYYRVKNTYYNILENRINILVEDLDNVSEWNSSVKINNIYNNQLTKFSCDLDKLISLTSSSEEYKLVEKNREYLFDFTESLKVIRSIVSTGLYLNNNIICEAVGEDNVLSEMELKFLMNLKDDLQNLLLTLEKSNNSLKQFNQVADDFIIKYSLQNAKKLL